MDSQAYLDLLLAQHISGEQEGLPIAEQIAPMLAAAKRLLRLIEADRKGGSLFHRRPFAAVPGERPASSIRVTTEG